MGLRDVVDSKIDVSLRQRFEAPGTVFTEQNSITLIHQGHLRGDCRNCSENWLQYLVRQWHFRYFLPALFSSWFYGRCFLWHSGATARNMASGVIVRRMVGEDNGFLTLCWRITLQASHFKNEVLFREEPLGRETHIWSSAWNWIIIYSESLKFFKEYF